MHSRKILVIAPDLESLPKTAVEIAAITRYHPESTVLRGTVRDEDIARAISEESFELMWFISHGSSDGILISDEVWLPTAALVQYVRADGIGLCILNTCSSEEIAREITASAGADVICTIGEVDNSDAARLGQLLAGELAYCETYREAYELVAPPGGSYRYYESGVIYRSYHSRDDDELIKMIYRLESDMRVMRWQNTALMIALILEAILMWRLYDKVG